MNSLSKKLLTSEVDATNEIEYLLTAQVCMPDLIQVLIIPF